MIFSRSTVALVAFVCVISTYLFLVHKEVFSDPSQSMTKIVLSVGQAKEERKQLVLKCQENNTECTRFSQMMKAWPPDKPRAVIYVLTRVGRQKRLINLLHTVDQYFTRQFPYPVIIFHSQMLRSSIPIIRNSTNSSLFFQEIEFELPDFLPPKEQWPKEHCKRSLGYKHMCRFQSKLVTEQPIIEQLDYIWRLDDDSSIRSPVKYDVFRFMRDKEIYYGYMCKFPSNAECVFGLWNATRKYIKMNHIEPKFFNEMTEGMNYFNNFEISKVSLWTSPEYKDYIDYIDRLGGIFYYRWGDAPIKTIGVSLFVPENKTHNFLSIGYAHRGCVNNLPKHKSN